MKTLNKILILTFGITLITLSGCKKEQGESRMTVKMVDAPGDFQEVNVEVLKVQVNHAGSGWIDLPTNAGIYDLLTLQNDVSATLVDVGVLPAGHLNQFRLILGDDNMVKVDDVYYPLSTPSAEQSGLKINLNADFEPNVYYQLLLDFDAANSIVIKGNGGYSLKPVIKVLSIQHL